MPYLDLLRGYHKMVVRYPIDVAQQIFVPGSIQGGGSKNKIWWIIGLLMGAGLLFGMVGVSIEPDQERYQQCQVEFDRGDLSEDCDEVLAQMDSSDDVVACGSLFCCGGLIMIFVAAFSNNGSRRTVIVQQGYVPQTTVIQPNSSQRIVHSGAVVNQGMQGQMPLNKNRPRPQTQMVDPMQTENQTTKQSSNVGAPSMEEVDKLAKQAKNLELARDFPKAAELYQKAGLFAEAGRIRQTYLENDKPMVQIGQIGDSVVKDSVIMGEQKSNLCPNCGVVIQPEWNFCPSCNSPL